MTPRSFIPSGKVAIALGYDIEAALEKPDGH